LFIDRNDAAIKLAKKLEKYSNTNGVVLAIPRGGVPIGNIISKKLGLPLELVLSKKIGHPRNPEFAIGSVSLDGALIDDHVMDVSMEYIRTEADRLLGILKEKYKMYMGDRKPTDLKNKTVIIVDDGVATGNTILATVEAIKKKSPKEIIIAVPVASRSAVIKLSKVADEFICLLTPDYFMGVGQFYQDFSQVTDQDSIQLLKEVNKTEIVH
jgi:predicted phosphoribosyltransferase